MHIYPDLNQKTLKQIFLILKRIANINTNTSDDDDLEQHRFQSPQMAMALLVPSQENLSAFPKRRQSNILAKGKSHIVD